MVHERHTALDFFKGELNDAIAKFFSDTRAIYDDGDEKLINNLVLIWAKSTHQQRCTAAATPYIKRKEKRNKN